MSELTDAEKQEVAGQVADLKAALDSLNNAVQSGAVTRAVIADLAIGQKAVELLVDVAFKAGS